jgi:flagellar motor component MotA
MEIKDFIKDALEQIVDGVQKANQIARSLRDSAIP